MNWKNRKVLITGSSGVIGRQLVNFLLDKGAIVLGIDIANNQKEFKNPRFELLQKDLLNLNPLDVLRFQPEIVFHLAAAFERSEERIEFWKNNYLNNLLINHNVVDSFTYCESISKFIFASSYLVYDPALYMFKDKNKAAVSLKEDCQKNPRNLTGAAKYYAEQEIDFFYKHMDRKIQFVSARIFRVYGQGSKDIVSRWVRAAIKGDALALHNRENSFDYINSIDVANALMNLAETDYSGSVNVGYGQSASISEIIEVLKSLFRSIKIKDEGMISDFEKSKADINLLKKITKWSPEIDIEKGINDIVSYEKKKSF